MLRSGFVRWCAGWALALAVACPALGDTPSDDGARRLTRSRFPKFFLDYSPDGSQIAYSRQHENRRAANRVLVGARVVRSDGTQDRALLPEDEARVQIQEHPAWSPDGRRLLITGGGNDTGNAHKDLFVCEIDRSFRASGLRKLDPGEGTRLGEEGAWSPDGRQIAFVTTTEQLWIVDADGRNRVQVVQVAGQYCHQPAWSPDGEWIAFATDRDENIELYKVRRDGADLTRLTAFPGVDCRPRWSRDARWILFSSNRNGNFDLFLMRSDGSDPRPLTRHAAVDDYGVWSPDRTHIAFVSLRDGGYDIYRLPVPEDVTISVSPPPPASEPLPAAAAGGLVAHFDFDGADARLALRDRAGRNHLELHSARRIGNGELGALEFDGRSAYATAGNGEALRIAGSLTLALRVAPERSPGNGYLVSKQGWNIYLGSDLVPRFETRSAADTAWETLGAAAAIPAGRWSHIAAVFDGPRGRAALFVDGKLSAERVGKDQSIGATAGHPLELGRYVAGGSQYFSGRLDEVRLWNRALTAAEIAQEALRAEETGE